MSSFSKSLFGTPGRIEALPSISPEQMQLLGQLVQGLQPALGSGLQNLQELLSGSPEAYARYEAPMMRQFHEQTIPGIAERFTGQGAQHSSAFAQQLGSAGAGLSEALGAQRGQLQQQAMQQLMGLLGQGMQSPFQYQAIPGAEGGLSKLMGGIGSGIGSGLGGGMGGLIQKLLGKLF